MRAQRLHERGGRLVAESVAEPVVHADEVLLDVEACGVGLTVLNGCSGALGREPVVPVVPGHEVVGRIVAVGTRGLGVGVGARVVATFHLSCGHCAMCRAGREPLCLDHRGLLGVDRDGGYAERMSLPARNCLVVDEGLAAVDTTVIADAVATSVHVCRAIAQVEPRQRVAVLGAGGGVGVHMVQVAQAFGAVPTGVDVASGKLEALHRLTGCTTALFDEVVDDPGRFDVVVDLVGRAATLEWGLSSLAPGGTLVLLTSLPEETLAVWPRAVVHGELSVRGAKYASVSDVRLAAELVGSGAVVPVVSEVRPLDRVEELHDMLRAGSLFGRGAVVP